MDGEEGKLFEFNNWFANDNIAFDFIKLTQISEVALEPGGQMYEHTQCCHEITYIISGEGFFYTNDEVMRVKSGDIHVVSKDDRHRIIASPYEKLRYICLGFDFLEISENYAEICEFYKKSPEVTVAAEGNTRYLFDMLIDEIYVKREIKSGALESIIKLILIKVFRSFAKASGRIAKEKSRKYGNMTVYKITKYIDSNIYDVKSVRDIAAALNFTENYVSHTFKANMGISLLAYIKKKKVEAAKVLMENGNMTLTEIAALLNFDSVQSLSRAFKLEYSKTPTQYLTEKGE